MSSGKTEICKRFCLNGEQQSPSQRHTLHDLALGYLTRNPLKVAHCACEFGAIYTIFVEVHCVLLHSCHCAKMCTVQTYSSYRNVPLESR